MTAEKMKITDATDLLRQFDTDPKAQRCLNIYRSIPDEKKDIFLMAMDAFLMGAKAVGMERAAV